MEHQGRVGTSVSVNQPANAEAEGARERILFTIQTHPGSDHTGSISGAELIVPQFASPSQCPSLPPAPPPQRGACPAEHFSGAAESRALARSREAGPAPALTSCVTWAGPCLSEPQLHSSLLSLPCCLTGDLQGAVK